MTVRPLHDRVLIKRIEEQETVKGGIIIPDTAKEKSQEGQVVAAGTGKTLENGSVVPLTVKAGDRYFSESIPEPKSSWRGRTI
jgi:chaperonin GroES